MSQAETKKKLDFIIACHQRSGSHFLQTCLHSHTGIWCFGEVANIALNKEQLIKHASQGRVTGGIVMYNQWERVADNVQFDKVIHLVRDPKKTAYSVVRNKRDKEIRRDEHRAHFRDGDALPPLYDAPPEDVVEWENRIVSSRAWFEGIVEEWPTLTVTYEFLTQDRSTKILPREQAGRILGFLGVEYQDLSTRLVKSGPPGSSTET